MFVRIILSFLLLNFTLVFAQKKSLTHDDYDLWKTFKNAQVSEDGGLVTVSVYTTTGRGDGYLKIYDAKKQKEYTFFNGTTPRISSNGQFVVFLEKIPYELTRVEKKKKLKSEERKKAKLFIFDVDKGVLVDSLKDVATYKLPKGYTEYMITTHDKKQKPIKDTTACKDAIYKNEYAVIYEFATRKKDTLRNMKNFALAEDLPALFYSKKRGKKQKDYGVYRYDFTMHTEKPIDTMNYKYDNIVLDKKGDIVSFMAAKDSTQMDSLKYRLYLWQEDKLKSIKNTQRATDWEISTTHKPFFSEHSKQLFFFEKPHKTYDIDTTLLKEELPEVDVWTYTDLLIQPEQKSRLKELRNKAYMSYVSLENNRIVSLQEEFLDSLILDKDKEQSIALGYSWKPYEVEKQWAFPRKRDVYVVDALNGVAKMLLKGATSFPYLEPEGNYAVYFSHKDGNWWSINLKNEKKVNLTAKIKTPFYDEENDVPALPEPYGIGGFYKDNDLLIFDRFDVWKVDVKGKDKPINITKNGRREQIEYRTLRLNSEDNRYVSCYDGKILLIGFDKKNKTSKLYTLDVDSKSMEALVNPGAMQVLGISLSEDENTLLYRKQSFTQYPDLYLYRPNGEDIKITDVNPQQKDYKWGTSEAFHWTAFDGTKLDGIIYKPEDFNPNKKYPVILYFYEKRSDNLHQYYSPQPSASIVNMSYLVSNDYVVFVPDIVYKKGHPGESAYNAIVSGAEALAKLPYVDAENMAIQGQSWGGYQVAYLITKTDMFKAAMGGAPVSNMTSAYGGIRWKSGLNRAFQYEKTQSRIGKTLWEGLDLYLENSPLFGIPNIETPLLIMHNDEDGAVPYYQGIEMFMGMRRLGKPVWLLVYNKEQHNLMKVKNRQDLSIRMMQFFDHYLKGKPVPKWMSKGVPAVDKGKDLGYDLEE